MSTFTHVPNPEHYTLEPVSKQGVASCPYCAFYDPDGCTGGPDKWVDQCLDAENVRKVWVLRPEIAKK